MTNAAIYARFSSDRQTEDSIEAQRRACADYAAKHGYTIVAEYVDQAISGKAEKTALRRQYQKMLRDCEKGLFSVILVHKYDRAARSVGEHVNLEMKLREKGITLIATAQDFGQSNEAKIMRTMMWALSEFYSDNLADETRKGLKETAYKGLHTGGVAPFGYDIADQKYIINETEAHWVRRLFRAAADREGFTAILEEMNACGVRGKRGKPIKYTQVYEMLRNEKYAGTYKYSPVEEKDRAARRSKPNAIKIENALPNIIDKALFERVQEIMNTRKQTGKKAGYLCSGLVHCTCGAKMHGITSRRKGHEYPYFVCSKSCGIGTVKMEEVEGAAVEYLHDLLSAENQAEITAALQEYSAGEKGRVDAFNSSIKKQIDQKRSQYDNLLSSLAAAVLPPEAVADVGERMKALKGEIEALQETTPPQDFTDAQIKTWLEALKAAADEEAIHLLIERIDLKTKTDFSITSTLKSVLGENGCGGWT